MTERMVQADGVELCVEAFGDPSHPTMLLIGGMAASMDWWEDGFCRRLADAGRHVVRYDHRDAGRSSHWPAGAPGYSAADLGADALRILDALGVGRAHLVGLSMGAGIAQSLAALHPERMATITLIATSPAGTRASSDELPGMLPAAAEAFGAGEPDWSDPEAVVGHDVAVQMALCGRDGVDVAAIERTARRALARTADPRAAATNHAMAAAGDDEPFRMDAIRAPALVLHGRQDPVFPPAHGDALAAELAEAHLVLLDGMGHEVPPEPLWNQVVALIAAHTAR